MPETVGQRLRAAREEKKLTLEKAAAATRLRVHHLQALENDDYSVMASAAQGRGFLRIYAAHLGLDLDQIIKDASVPATTTPEPTPPAPETPPQSAPEAAPVPEPDATAMPARSGFWSRLLRRRAAEPVPEPAATITSAPPETAPVTEQASGPGGAPVRKPRATKPRASKAKKNGELVPSESNEAAIEAASDKKKLTLNP